MVAEPTITPRDRELIAALDDPASIDPVEYAEWIERPEIQRAIAARDNLRAREEHAKLSRFRDRVLAEASAALDTLKAVLARDNDSDEKLLEARRAATSITRLARSCLNPIAPPRPWAHRPHAASMSTVHCPLSTVPSGQSPTANGQPPSSPAHALTRSPAHASPPSPLSPPPSRIRASQVPGLEAAIAQFLRAVGTPGAAAPLIAAHRARDIGDNLAPWLISRTTPLRNPVRPTRVYYHDRYDAADQFVEITHASGARSQSIIHAVLERHPDRTPARWAIADVTHDTS